MKVLIGQIEVLCIRENHFISSSTEKKDDCAQDCDWSGCKLDVAWSTGPSTGKPGWTCCSIENPCTVGEGDCDSNDECEFPLRCGENNCNAIHNSTEFADQADCCVSFLNKTCKSNWKGGSDADTWSCCTDRAKCIENEGDCDSDDQCIDGLICGENNCIFVNPGLNFDPAADCCIQPDSSKYHDQWNCLMLFRKTISCKYIFWQFP